MKQSGTSAVIITSAALCLLCAALLLILEQTGSIPYRVVYKGDPGLAEGDAVIDMSNEANPTQIGRVAEAYEKDGKVILRLRIRRSARTQITRSSRMDANSEKRILEHTYEGGDMTPLPAGADIPVKGGLPWPKWLAYIEWAQSIYFVLGILGILGTAARQKVKLTVKLTIALVIFGIIAIALGPKSPVLSSLSLSDRLGIPLRFGAAILFSGIAFLLMEPIWKRVSPHVAKVRHLARAR